ncbi:hypothetical protein GCM10022414_29800 [Zhongshania borealis]|uniref:Transposase n=1 Tax=Zhongshania borealis TaxID=889488 RepID=A0ABP7X151_9GAMM
MPTPSVKCIAKAQESYSVVTEVLSKWNAVGNNERAPKVLGYCRIQFKLAIRAVTQQLL